LLLVRSQKLPCLSLELMWGARANKAGLTSPVLLCRLHDVIHADRRLYLVFEYLDLDLKKLMDGMPTFSSDHRLIKVSTLLLPQLGGRRRLHSLLVKQLG